MSLKDIKFRHLFSSALLNFDKIASRLKSIICNIFFEICIGAKN